MAKTLFMETTQITAEKTAGEIMATLVSSGARQIALDYDAGRISGLSFVLPVNGLHLLFKLPSRVEPVFKVLNERRPAETWQRGNQKDWAERDRQQAERVAWRQLLRWLQAQVAMVSTGMVAAQEVFLPYMQDQDGKTVYEMFAESKFKMLAAPAEGQER